MAKERYRLCKECVEALLPVAPDLDYRQTSKYMCDICDWKMDRGRNWGWSNSRKWDRHNSVQDLGKKIFSGKK